MKYTVATKMLYLCVSSYAGVKRFSVYFSVSSLKFSFEESLGMFDLFL